MGFGWLRKVCDTLIDGEYRYGGLPSRSRAIEACEGSNAIQVIGGRGGPRMYRGLDRSARDAAALRPHGAVPAGEPQ
jgi:hypothetical protein